MSPIGFRINRSIQTGQRLDGPTLSWVEEPADTQEGTDGLASFTGIATVAYPDSSTVGGTISYQWYYRGSPIEDTSVDPNSDANIEQVGTATTLTLSNIDYTDSGNTVYVEANYIPPAWPTDENNANNELFKSRNAILTAQPEIVITSQPVNSTIGENLETVFSIDAAIPRFDVLDNPDFVNPNPPGVLAYQWKLDGADLIEGTQNTNATTSGTGGKLTISSDLGTEVIDFAEIASYDNFSAGRVYTLTTDADITFRTFLTGGGGGRSIVRSVSGGAGGAASGVVTLNQGTTYTLVVGGAGINGGAGGYNGGGNGGGGHGSGGGGGGFTVLYEGTTASQENAIIIAGGGGGGSNDPATGGQGGGENGSAASKAGRGGFGGTQTAGGAAGGADGSSGNAGSALQGGSGASGGGGGYFGGGGGQFVGGCCADGAGGGGSGFLHPTKVTEGNFTGSGSAGTDGTFRLERESTIVNITVTISGSNTDRLTISSNTSGFAGKLTCELTATGVQNSPLTSSTVNFVSVPPRNIVEFEAYTLGGDYKTRQIDLDTLNTFSVDSGTFGSDYSIIQFHLPENEFPLTIDMFGARGDDQQAGIGGEGGFSKIRFTPTRNTEYTIIGISNNSAIFLYRGSTLIAVVGQGGGSGLSGVGGDGGGVQQGGENALGSGGGRGADAVDDGEVVIGLNGTFGSIYEGTNITAVLQGASYSSAFPNGDTVATGRDGGQTISCSKGTYWINQGISPCANNTVSGVDNDNVQFYTQNGILVPNSAPLTRGFKPGYTITDTRGTAATSNSGNGGNGAVGGTGGFSGFGGGGGSGYTNGEVTVLDSQTGGGDGVARFVVNGGIGGYFVDDVGRILILSSPDNRDPRTLNKTNGIVNIGDAACIDDDRWQSFLNLARDGTQDYRLTATRNGETTRITTATNRNIYRMMNSNVFTLRTSLTDWYDSRYSYLLLTLAWDEISGGMQGVGLDYSILSWSTKYGYGYYGLSNNSFFSQTNYSIFSANWWILPPGVPDFD